ncbi:MAG: hypothetical protein U1F36_08105 [Planctomycetota bacterium]
MSPVTGSTLSNSVLEAYCVELRRLASTITGFLEVAERRSDLASPNDAIALAEMTGIVDDLARRLSAHAARTHTALPAGFVAPQARPTDAPAAAASDPHARTIEALAGPAVQGSVGETVGGTFGLRQHEYAHWFSLQSKPTSGRAAPVPGAPRDIAPPPQRPASTAANRSEPNSAPLVRAPAALASQDLLSHLLGTVGGEVAMKGTSESMAMPLVFDFLVRLKRTGCLHVRTSTEHLRFVFAEGMIVATATDNQPSGQRIGEILRQLGLLPRRHLARLIEKAETEKRPLGRLLVDEQLVTIPQITKALTIQVQARFERAFGAGRAAFAFVPNSGSRIDDRLCVDARSLLTEMRRRTGQDNAPPTDDAVKH